MKSIYFKNFTATAAMVMASFFILALAFVFLGRSYVIRDRHESMAVNARVIAHTAVSISDDGTLYSWPLRMTLSSMAQASGDQLFLCDESGVVVSCSDMNLSCEHIGRHISGAEFSGLLKTGKLDKMTTLGGFYKAPHYVVAEVIPGMGVSSGNGYVFVSAEPRGMVAGWDTFLGVFLAASVAVMVLALILAFMTAKRMAKPLDDMAIATRKFAHGDFSARVKYDDRTDEVGALVSAFNTMADSLERSEQRRNDFIANVSHELKTPMTTISGFADGLLDGTIPKDRQDQYLVVIADETRRLSRLVRSMLDLSRMESAGSDLARRREFDLSEVVISTLLSFEARAADKKLDVDLQVPEHHINVLGDPDAITRVVYNLMDNAIKFAYPGSTLGVSLWKNDGKAYVSVRDTGETIPAEDLPFIFDRFHKSDRSRSLDRDGVGLGLYLVKRILNAHGEDIAVTSRDGVTDFVFTLTLAGEKR